MSGADDTGTEQQDSADSSNGDTPDSDDTDMTGNTDPIDHLLHAWKRPRNTFLLGILLGSLLVGTLVVSPPAALESTPPEEVGEAVVDHYQQRAPTGLSYELVSIRSHDSGLYQVTVDVQSGEESTEEDVYVTDDGKWVFERPPSQVQPQVTG